VAIAAAVAVTLSGSVAEAQPPPRAQPTPAQLTEARRWFETGRERYEQGEWRSALESFRRAYDLTGSPEVLFNIGQCADRLRMDRDALAAFELYLERLPDAPDRPNVESRIQVLRAEIARHDEVTRQRDAARAERARLERERRLRGGSPGTDEGDGTLLGQWWFWTVIVVAIAGGVTAGVLLSQENEPIPGSDGGVITTLRFR
jgi:tetratricopeptide (TPR) repeat protein